jgi:hypothetical protein
MNKDDNMRSTTFNQVIGSKTFTIAVPVTRVDKLIARVDNLIDLGKLDKAKEVLAPFILNKRQQKKIAANDQPQTVAPPLAKGAIKQQALALISKLDKEKMDRPTIITTIQKELNLSYANARYYVVNVAKIA